MTPDQQLATSFARRATLLSAVIASLALGACQREQAPAADTAAAGGDAMSDMPGMGGMDHGAMQGGGMMEQMQSHMRMMDGANPDSIRAMLPMHRQMAANMLAQFNREMRDMNMPEDKAWTSLVDSLRQDLRTMPEWSTAELRARVPAHHERLTRLMQMHGEMMKNMRM